MNKKALVVLVGVCICYEIYHSVAGGSSSSSIAVSSEATVDTPSTPIVIEVQEENSIDSTVTSEPESTISAEDKYKSENIKTAKTAAFRRKFSEYTIYYIFDFENETVTYFVTNGSYVQKGTISGNLTHGYDIDFPNEGYSEYFDIGVIGLDGTLIDSSGFDLEFKRAGDIEAQEALESVQK